MMRQKHGILKVIRQTAFRPVGTCLQLAKYDGEILASESYNVSVDSLNTSDTKTPAFTDYMPDYKASMGQVLIRN